MSKDKCIHGVSMYKECATCNKEMMIDFIVHNLEEITTEEAVQCIREGILTIGELNDGLERRLKHG
jgi:hypothetical protein